MGPRALRGLDKIFPSLESVNFSGMVCRNEVCIQKNRDKDFVESFGMSLEIFRRKCCKGCNEIGQDIYTSPIGLENLVHVNLCKPFN